jgi:hypothetical protein
LELEQQMSRADSSERNRILMLSLLTATHTFDSDVKRNNINAGKFIGGALLLLLLPAERETNEHLTLARCSLTA